MAASIPKNGHKARAQTRRRALAIGARSAFDISGAGTLDSDLFARTSDATDGPSPAVAADLRRVMETFGRTLAVESGAADRTRSRSNGESDARSTHGSSDEH
jgi:hypothetical protein